MSSESELVRRGGVLFRTEQLEEGASSGSDEQRREFLRHFVYALIAHVNSDVVSLAAASAGKASGLSREEVRKLTIEACCWAGSAYPPGFL